MYVFIGQELNDFSVWIAMIFNTRTANLSSAAMFYYHEGAVDKGSTLSIVNVDGTDGRYIIVQSNTGRHLSLCEVEVYAIGE